MNDLVDYLAFIVNVLQASQLCKDVHISETQIFSNRQFSLKVRAEPHNGSVLQVRLYVNKPHIDYAYQVIRNEVPFIRWDNKEHFPASSSFPHHFHRSDYQVSDSPLTGNPEHDLPLVLGMLADLP